MKITNRPSLSHLFQYLFITTLLAGYSLHARVVDDFNTGVSGYSTTLNSGSFSASSPAGQLIVTPVAFAGGLTYGKKNTETFMNVATHTLEFKVLVNSILTNATTTNGLALLGWLPTGGAIGVSGYTLAVGPLGAGIFVNSSFAYVTNFATPIQSSNMFLAIRMTPDGANVIVKSTAYNKADGRYNVLFEHTLTNSPGIIGTGGNVIVGAYNDGSGAATQVNFDDLQVFDTVRVLLDNFSGPYPGTSWTDYIPGTATNYNDGSGHLVTVNQSGGTTSGTFKSDKTYKISDGVRLELRADVFDSSAGGPANFSTLSYIPNGIGDFGSLQGYLLAFTSAQFYSGKSLTSFWDPAFTPTAVIPQTNVRLIQTLTGEGASVRIESRLEDLNVDVNDPARVVYQFMHIDSSSPFLNKDGYFALSQYHAGGPGNDATIWDSVEVNTELGGNAPPLISGQSPVDGKNFYNTTGGVAFNVSDEVSAPINNLKLTLNGVVYTNGSPGVTITPTNASSISRRFTFTNLAPNVFYVGSIQASDNLGATTTVHYEFDTFLTNNLQVEAEDFNYSNNPTVDGGEFFDTGLNAYAGLRGTAEIDYHDSRTGGNNDSPIPYRPLDYPRQYPTGDPSRPQYVNAGQPELLVYDNNNGDWRNYTRTYPAGTYNVYSRQSTFALPKPLVTLERVTSDAHTNNQTTAGLGAFLQLGDAVTGYDVHRNVPLTDAFGNPTVVRFAGGVNTLRVTDVYVDDNESADVFHNYLVFVPTADPGTLRPIVTQTAPLPGNTFRQSPETEATFASIANRDTSVNTNTIALTINGSPATITVTPTTGGADVAWSFTALPVAASYTNTLTFQDTDGTNASYSWTYSYPLLRATNRLPLGALATRGFDVRMVQSDVYVGADNTIQKGEDQLRIPPVSPLVIDRTWQTNVQVLDWNDNTGIPNYVPGLDDGISGYPHQTGGYNFIATEELAYIELTAGAHRFVVNSDDSFQLRSGTNLTDLNATVLGFNNGSSGSDISFDFVVEAAGLYPLRGMWQEEGGGANFRLSALNPISGTNNLVNDPADLAGAVKAYIPGIPTLALSSAAVGGPYSVAAGAVMNTATKTVTLPVSGSMQFYRMQSSSAVTIQSITVVGGTVVIKYQ